MVDFLWLLAHFSFFGLIFFQYLLKLWSKLPIFYDSLPCFQLFGFFFFDYLLKWRIRRISIAKSIDFNVISQCGFVDISQQWPVCSTRGALTGLFLFSVPARSHAFYPPGRKSVALQLGVHLILLYFIRIWSWVRRLFFYFGGGWWKVGGRWWVGANFLVLQISLY